VLAAAGTALLTACGQARQPATSPSSGPERAPVTISYVHLGEQVFYEMNVEAAREFKAAHPHITVEVTWTQGVNLYEKVQQLYLANEAPDVWEPAAAYFPDWVARGTLRDLSDYIRRDQGKGGFDLNDIWPKYRRSGEYKGRLYGLLCRFTVNALFYNQDLLERAGVPFPSDRWTWDDLFDAARKTARDADRDGKLDTYGYVMYVWNHTFWAYGGEMLVQKGDRWRATFAEPRGIEGLQFLADMMHKHRVAAKPSEVAGNRQIDVFIQGQAALSDQRVTRVPDVRKANNAALRWDVGPLPRGRAGRFSYGTGVNRSIAAPSKYPEEAWLFVRFLFTKPEIATISIPPNMSFSRSPKFLQAYDQPKNMAAFLDAIAYSKDYPVEVQRWPELEQLLTPELRPLWEGQAEAKAVAEAIDRRLNAQLAEWGMLAA
jgi:multiple sugar transport system substrate-binding protein